ncbi:hypothetical protein BASA82_000739 [Batrachochytrium salamandrivorans]|nr:hypothetical protein BASA82_000739 [Batrachochytrium salamandrivorans]
MTSESPSVVSLVGVSNKSPEFQSGLFVRWTYGWISPLLRDGYNHPLEQSELWLLDEHLQSKNINKRFDVAWQQELLRPDASRRSSSYRLIRALLVAFGYDYIRSGLFMFVESILLVGSSVLLLYLITWIQDTQTKVNINGDWFGYTMAISIFLAQLFTTFAENWQFELTTKTGYYVRAALTSALYKKSLVLSGRSRLQYSAGMITNIIATDTNRVDIACQFLNLGWGAPLQIAMATGLLIWTIGPSALVGLTIVVLYIPLQLKITGKLTSSRRAANIYADKRIRLIQEALLGIRVIKIYSWEESFQKVVSNLRAIELKHIRGFLMSRAVIAGVTQAVPPFAMISSFVCYSLLGNQLNPAKIFASLSLFYSFRFALMFLPFVITQVTDSLIATERIGSLLLAEELTNGSEMLPLSEDINDPAIFIDCASFEWDYNINTKDQGVNPSVALQDTHTDSPKSTTIPSLPTVFHLDKIDTRIPRGKLVAIVGVVGSGKSSLLNALVGEMRRISGNLTFRGSVGYCQQQAWIQNTTVRENILFGLPYHAQKYKEVIRACALESDLAILSSGDATEIGERGINLSGGQKQRVSIARAMYFDPDIVLLDDPLSAVDSHVGRHLFEECICKALSGKTRLLVTHQLHFLPSVDYILVMENGRIASQGTYQDLSETSASFAEMMKNYGGMDDEVVDTDIKNAPVDTEENALIELPTDVDENCDRLSARKRAASIQTNAQSLPADKTALTQRQMIAEERNVGSVNTHFYMSYLRLAGGVFAGLVLVLFLIISQVSRVMTDQWLAYWSSDRLHLPRDTYIASYVGIGVFQVITSIAYGAIVAYLGAIASQKIHDLALSGVFRSPISFFDSTPLGRIVSRFSRDIDGVDSLLPDSIRVVVQSLSMTISNFVLIAVIFPLFLAPLVPILVGFYFLQAYYRSTARELKRLDSISRSPLIANVSETLSGLSTIRAYNATNKFTDKIYMLMDNCNRNYYPSLIIQRWIQLRLESLSSILVLMSAVFAVLQKSTVGAGISGLVVAYAIQVTSVLNWSVKRATETEMSMNSAERLIYYIEDLVPEAPDTVTRDASGAVVNLRDNWPHAGQIEVKDIMLRYRPDLPLVLSGVTFTVMPGQKIGIVGRTGAGKSSIMSCILRLFELDSGSVVIDGLDVSRIGLRDLRRRIGVIPQEPVLFSGTIRSNLDPFELYQDSELWDALDRAGLKGSVAAVEGG